MDLTYPDEIEAFRREVRAFLESKLPSGWPRGERPEGERWTAFSDEWNKMLHATGWATPTWPERYGGRGLDVLRAAVFADELARVDAPIQPPAGGEILVGPTILHLGSEAQRQRYLPPIARGEAVWCQGFSEPGSGSDLASLQTTARLEGDELVIDGHKIWTSQAQEADHMFVLARTDPDAPAHRGISYLLLSMDQPGVEIRSIAQPDGTAGFAEVLLEGVRCPVSDVVGELHDGWRVAMSTLGFERGTSATSSWYRYARDLEHLCAVARRRGIANDRVLRQRLAGAWMRIQLMRIQGFQVLTSALHPEVADRTRAIEAGTKLSWTEFHKELTELGIDVLGAEGMVPSGDSRAAVGVGLGRREPMHPYPIDELHSAFLFARAGTIYGGTSEVQRNIIAERVLGLPREPSPRGTPALTSK